MLDTINGWTIAKKWSLAGPSRRTPGLAETKANGPEEITPEKRLENIARIKKIVSDLGKKKGVT